ncbi:MAG TPA: T9SS type A sorting domain-containing protein, partial [Aequorivita sp.]|nr:T9SS type A sorting domain-containing protein [Aequorivita sp.]
VWQKALGGSGQDMARSIQQTNDNGYIIAGMSNSIDGDVTGNHGDYDYWVVKLSEAGDLQWQKTYGGSASDAAYIIQQTEDDGYIVAGSSISNNGDATGNHGSGDYWVVKLNTTGNIQWQKSLGGSGWESATTIQQTLDGGYIVSGESSSTDGDVTGNHGSYDFWTVKLTESGTIQWQTSNGGSGFDSATSLQQTIDGGYIVAGYAGSTDGEITGNHGESDYWIIKLKTNGTLEWQKTMGGSSWDSATTVQKTFDGGYIIAGFSESIDGDVTDNQGGPDYWIVKLHPEPLSVDQVANPINCYPNPVSSILNITALEPIKSVTVYDQLGQMVMTVSHSTPALQLNLSELSTNIYQLVVETDKAVETKRIVVH